MVQNKKRSDYSHSPVPGELQRNRDGTHVQASFDARKTGAEMLFFSFRWHAPDFIPASILPLQYLVL